MKHLLLLLLFFQLPEKPDNYVTNDENILMKWQEDELNGKLRDFEKKTSTQLFVYVAKSLRGKNIEQYSKDIFNKWGIGQESKNNGILIAIFIDDREQRIQVGSGLESTLPSSLLSEIQEEQMNPNFREREYHKGIDAGIDKLIYYSNHAYEPKSANHELWVTVGWIFGVSVVLVIINLALLKSRKSPRKRTTKLTVIAILFLFVPLLGPAAVEYFQLDLSELFLIPPLAGALALLLMTVVTGDKEGSKADYDGDDYHQRRMYDKRSEPDSDDRFSGGDGGSSDGGGSSSKW